VFVVQVIFVAAGWAGAMVGFIGVTVNQKLGKTEHLVQAIGYLNSYHRGLAQFQGGLEATVDRRATFTDLGVIC